MRSTARPRRARQASAESGARHATHLRGLNLERVLAAAMDRPGLFTRQDLIQAIHLSAPTVGSLVADLLRERLLITSRAGRTSTRPPC